MSSIDIRREEALHGVLVEGRECGDCTACCAELEVSEATFSKPARQSCPHCTGTACAIYDERPMLCRTWYCGWRFIGAMSEHDRPDRSNLLLLPQARPDSTNPFSRLCIVVRPVGDGRELTSRPALRILAMLMRGDLPVWISRSGGTNELLYPSETVVSHIEFGTLPAGEVGQEVTRWRRLLAAAATLFRE
jgi:hypothetical protein